ncbi:hypothetical protein_gp212 [Bacillus phage vB_BceM_WH1]|nr:hypothetical protein_gp212 [Bacillus phage vB_BceM_WH1]
MAEDRSMQEVLDDILSVAEGEETPVPAEAAIEQNSWEREGFGALEAFVCERLEDLPHQPILSADIKTKVNRIMSAEKVSDLDDLSVSALEATVEEMRRPLNGHLNRLDDFAPRVARAMPIERESDFI